MLLSEHRLKTPFQCFLSSFWALSIVLWQMGTYLMVTQWGFWFPSSRSRISCVGVRQSPVRAKTHSTCLPPHQKGTKCLAGCWSAIFVMESIEELEVERWIMQVIQQKVGNGVVFHGWCLRYAMASTRAGLLRRQRTESKSNVAQKCQTNIGWM